MKTNIDTLFSFSSKVITKLKIRKPSFMVEPLAFSKKV